MVTKTNPQNPVQIIASPGHRWGTVNLEARQDGKTIEAMTFHKNHAQNRHRFAKKAGVADEVVLAAIQQAIPPLDPVKATESLASNPFCLTLRGIYQAKAEGQVFTNETPLVAFQDALAIVDHPFAEPVIEWSDPRQLAVLDVDYHEEDLDHRPDAPHLQRLVEQVRPQPSLWWRTHGCGLRLVYVAQQGFLAEELAACATLSLRALDPAARVEILVRTRHPAYPRSGYPAAGPVTIGHATVEIGALARVLGKEVDGVLVQEWLDEHGLEFGKKYIHDRCPVDPGAVSHGEPVYVGETGITCFKCEASGLTCGSRKPGCFPYAALISGGLSQRIRTVVQHCTHWEQAQHLLAEELGITGDMAKRCYAALLKVVHGSGDPRVQQALDRGKGLVRSDGYWVTADLTRAHNKDGLVERLKVLPAVQKRISVGGHEVFAVNEEKLGIFRGVDDLSEFGYPRVQPIRGMKISGHWQARRDPRVVQAVVLPDFLRDESMRLFRPQYVPLKKRMALEKAEEIISRSFPGVNHDYLKLLIAARGCAESGTGQPPMIAVDGPSGAGKSTTVGLAAALIGDQHQNVPWTPNLEHFLQKMYEASLNAGLVSSDEIIKLASMHGDVLVGLSALLSFTEKTLIRKLYTGPVSVQQVPALVITDIAFPRELFCDEQLGRRHVHVHLDRKVDWQKTAKAISRWRALSCEHAEAANAIVSHIIDRFFADESPAVFDDIAHALGFELLNQGGDTGLDPKDDLLALFVACCAPEAIAAPTSTWKGKGWKLIKRDGMDALSQRWLTVCDNVGEGFVSSRRVKETDWAQLLNVEEAAECDLVANGKSALAIRFRCGNPRSSKMRANEEIKPQEPPEPPPPPPSPPDPSAPDQPTDSSNASSSEAPSNEPKPVPLVMPSVAGPLSASPVFIDLETRSCCDLKREGGRHYAQHSSTEILTAVALIDNQIIVWAPLLNTPPVTNRMWPEGYGIQPMPILAFAGPTLPAPLAEAIAAGRPFCAHNAFDFDMRVWEAKGLPKPAEWLDTLPQARAAGLPGKLDDLGERLLGRGKDKEGAALVKRLCQPDRQGRFLPFTAARAEQVIRYNIADVLLLARVFQVVCDRGEPDVITLDHVINERGVGFDDHLARSLVRLESQLIGKLKAEVEQVTEGAIKADDLRRDKHLQRWLQLREVHLHDLRQATIQSYLDEEEDVDPVVLRVLEARISANRITTSKLENALAVRDHDGRVRDLLVYHQAATGRWAGRRVQPHNLPRPHKDLKDMQPLLDAVNDPARFQSLLPSSVSAADALSALTRQCFRAAEGMKLCMVDFASIEARGVAWCANEAPLLERFQRGEDVYLGLAAHIFGRPVTAGDKAERQVGKVGILGCGYGMGVKKFAATCTSQSIDLAAAGTTAEVVVDGYRDAYPAIAGTKVTNYGKTWRQGGLWKDVEAAARDAILTGVPSCAGRCWFSMEGSTLLIQLPSGRKLHYRNARIEDRVPGYCRELGLPEIARPTIVVDSPKQRDVQTYGGKLTENIVQAICRDLLVNAMLECQRQGLPIVLHVHDEIVIEVPADKAEEALRHLAVIMSTPPAWAKGFPIEVEGFAAERYLKGAPKGVATVKARGGVIL